jgi:hypothetical protein
VVFVVLTRHPTNQLHTQAPKASANGAKKKPVSPAGRGGRAGQAAAAAAAAAAADKAKPKTATATKATAAKGAAVVSLGWLIDVYSLRGILAQTDSTTPSDTQKQQAEPKAKELALTETPKPLVQVGRIESTRRA